MSWKAVLACLVLAIAGGFGCFTQHCTNDVDCFYTHSLCIAPHLSPDPRATIAPATPAVPLPMTVDDTLREPHYMSLREAFAMALENGTVGNQNPTTPGFASDNLGGFLGTTVGSADSIRALALDPAIVANNIELSLSKFDAMWNTSANWDHTVTPFGTSPALPGDSPTAVGAAAQNTTRSAQAWSSPCLRAAWPASPSRTSCCRASLQRLSVQPTSPTCNSVSSSRCFRASASKSISCAKPIRAACCSPFNTATGRGRHPHHAAAIRPATHRIRTQRELHAAQRRGSLLEPVWRLLHAFQPGRRHA